MDKKEFNALMKEATDEFKKEKKDRVKLFLKERMQEYEMAKATVKRLDKEFERIRKVGIENEAMLLNYDE